MLIMPLEDYLQQHKGNPYLICRCPKCGIFLTVEEDE
jgi:hypothetical protein